MAAHWFHAVPAAPPDKGIDAALRAAEWAQDHVAHQQAKEQLGAALELIAGMPKGHQRSARELEVQDQLCVLLIASTSYTDPEFGRVCARVRELCEEIDDHVLLAPALYRLSLHHVMRVDVAAGIALGEQLLDPLRSGGTSSARLAGHIALGWITHANGDQTNSRPHFDRAIEMCDAGHDAALVRSVIEEPAVLVRNISAVNWWLRGDEDRAEQEASDALEIALRTGRHTWSTMVSFWAASTVSLLRRDAATTFQRCDEGIALAIAGGYGLGVPYMGANQGWAIAALGDVEAGTTQILERAALAQAFGAVYMRPLFLGMHADACLMGGRFDDAIASADEGLLVVESTGDRLYEAELHRLRGEAQAGLGRADHALEEFHNAIRIATAQGALGLLRRAEDSLACASLTA
jgi:adenylate cyclase